MFTNNQIFNDTYQILRPIGSGGSSRVYLAYHLRLCKYVVIKQLNGQFSSDFLARTEVDILKNLHHPNLPQVYDIVQKDGAVYTVIDYVDGHDLESYISGAVHFTEDQLKRYLCQILQVLGYLHSQNPPVIHSDIKPGNIIINGQSDAILIDFNTSLGANQGNLLGLTMPYASPEQIQLAQVTLSGQQTDIQLDSRTDIYSLGATFYELISGIRPTAGVQPRALHTMGLSLYSRDFLLVIDKMMEYDPERRFRSTRKILHTIERMDNSYWKIFAVRCASMLVCAGLLAGGIYCWIRGAKQEIKENYDHYHQTAQAYIRQGEPQAAQTVCQQILNDQQMQSYLQEAPARLARFYHLLGDAAYFQQSYETAAVYYAKALENSQDLDQTLLAIYYRDAAIAHAECGNANAAQQLLGYAKAAGAAENDILLIQIVLDARQGNESQCHTNVKKLFAGSTQQEQLLRAALSAAAVSTNADMQIQWLNQALRCGGGRLVSRQLAGVYGQIALQSSGAQRKEAAENAAELYQQLCQWEYAPVEDFLNYATVLRVMEKDQQAVLVLQTGLQQMPGEYRLLMNLCFIYHDMGDSGKAATYCAESLRAWRADVAPDKLSKESDEIQNLMALAKLYGVGG